MTQHVKQIMSNTVSTQWVLVAASAVMCILFIHFALTLLSTLILLSDEKKKKQHFSQ